MNRSLALPAIKNHPVTFYVLGLYVSRCRGSQEIVFPATPLGSLG